MAQNRGLRIFRVIAHVRRGVSIDAARAELTEVSRRLQKTYPDTNTGWTAQFVPLEERVVGVLKTCFDPEIPVNIYELGLIYAINVDAASAVEVKMTLTSPMCPVAGSLPPEVEGKIRKVAGVTSVKVELVWDPPWTPAMMSEAAKLQLNMF